MGKMIESVGGRKTVEGYDYLNNGEFFCNFMLWHVTLKMRQTKPHGRMKILSFIRRPGNN